ncbi:LacI family DNA-binding transcriptional regulator [Flavobacteriaceae bacterium]|nr:LacI family DNA-binding transcriptional regulator [Flavobacteriaceae bacterium]
MKNLTLKDIAAALNISVTTVSKALKNYPDVSVKTKERVKAYAEKVNFTPNSFAAYLRTHVSKTIGIVIPRLNHYFFSSILNGIISEAEKHEYMTFILCSEESYELEKVQIQRLLSKNVDGVFLSIADKTHDMTHIQNIIDNGTNLVIFDKYSKLTTCSSVVINDRKAAYTAVKHLIKKGKKRIAHFRGPLLPQNSIDRFLGYKQALEDHGIEYDKNLVFICDEINNSEGYDHAQTILDQKLDVDAIFAVADLPAIGAIKCLLENRIKIPDQIAVMGFSNWMISSLITPSLSTIDQPGELMGRKAFKVFIEERKSKKRNEPVVFQKYEIETTLVERNST